MTDHATYRAQLEALTIDRYRATGAMEADVFCLLLDHKYGEVAPKYFDRLQESYDRYMAASDAVSLHLLKGPTP